jgi:hypothetical protein
VANFIRLPEMSDLREVASKLRDSFKLEFTRQSKIEHIAHLVIDELNRSKSASLSKSHEIINDCVLTVNNFIKEHVQRPGEHALFYGVLGLCYIYSNDISGENFKQGNFYLEKAINIFDCRRFREYTGLLFYKYEKYEKVLDILDSLPDETSQCIYEIDCRLLKIDELSYSSNIYLNKLELTPSNLRPLVNAYIEHQETKHVSGYVKIYPDELFLCVKDNLPKVCASSVAEILTLLNELLIFPELAGKYSKVIQKMSNSLNGTIVP